MKKRLSFIIIGHCFFLFQVITDQAFQWLDYIQKEKYACMLKKETEIMSKSLYIYMYIHVIVLGFCGHLEI